MRSVSYLHYNYGVVGLDAGSDPACQGIHHSVISFPIRKPDSRVVGDLSVAVRHLVGLPVSNRASNPMSESLHLLSCALEVCRRAVDLVDRYTQ